MDTVLISPARSLLCCWPGLPQLWRRGSWAGLAVALAWGLLANWLLAATLVWAEVAAPTVLYVGWASLAVVWLTAFVVGFRWNRQIDKPDDKRETTDVLRTAQTEYLRGNWLVAEAHLEDVLAADADDAEARLMLVSLYRHTGRKSKAGEHLRALERLAAASKWRLEIEHEKRLMNEMDEPSVIAPDPNELPRDEQPITQNAIDRNNTEDTQQPAAA
ncbi:MAG: hypothetical protein MI757_14525 [Pirellulales bacterium]|nr:hypothetical protein [Pirellulales bacterium]